MRTFSLAALVLAGTALSPCLAAAPAGVIEAGIVRGAVVAGPAGGTLAPLAQGGPARGMPVISPDGTRVAFVQMTDKRVALAEVVVVAMDGRTISRAKVEPVVADTAYSGMQAIEALRWVSAERVVVRGSINPGQSQYYVIEAATGKTVGDFTDDASGAAFSPDGLHVAALSGSPHFGPAAAALAVDGKVVWQGAAGATVAGAPRFSADGAGLAWAARDAGGHASLVVWRGGAVRQAAVPASGDAVLGVRWSGGRPMVTARSGGRTLGWALGADGRVSQGLAVDPEAGAVALRERLVRGAGGVAEPDFWCAACGLEGLVRGTE